MSNQCRNPCREAAHYQACRRAGEEASPDHSDSHDRTWAPKVLMVLTPGEPSAPDTTSRDDQAAGQAPARDRRLNVSASVRSGTDPPATASFASTARVHADAAQNASVSSGVQARVLARM
jgi:hypothetical protein